jgi:hypothetical protein
VGEDAQAPIEAVEQRDDYPFYYHFDFLVTRAALAT